MKGYVYLIGTPIFRWYKIGKSRTPTIRIQNIGVLLPFKISVIGVWSAVDHTALESLLHERHSSSRINGEWFRFSKQEVEHLFHSLPVSARIFPSDKNSFAALDGFTNLPSDCPDDSHISFRVRKMRGDLTPEERQARRIASMVEVAQKRISEGRPLSAGLKRALDDLNIP